MTGRYKLQRGKVKANKIGKGLHHSYPQSKCRPWRASKCNEFRKLVVRI